MEGLVSSLPPCLLVAAYGSGVFPQGAASALDASRLTDLLVVAEDGPAWHEANLALHPEHYPRWLRDASRAERVQRTGGAGMLFFPFVQLGGVRAKYGVIGRSRFEEDLRQWDTLYCSGRLQKPVRLLHADSSLLGLLEGNLGFAASAAMVLMHSKRMMVHSEADVFLEIARISYDGDIRMALGEDPHKIRRIVMNNLAGFSALYRRQLDEMLDRGELQYGAPVSEQVAKLHMTRLPPRLRDLGVEELQGALFRTVRRSSAMQTMKNAATAGLSKSLRYGLRKVGKRFFP